MARPKKQAPSPGAVKKVQQLAGTLDIPTDFNPLWDILFKRFDRYAKNFGFGRLELPFLEDSNLFHLYDPKVAQTAVCFDMQGRGSVAVRPHMLPQVLRAYAAVRGDGTGMSKFSFSGQVVQTDSKGKISSDVQFGYEVCGAFTHLTEAQAIAAAWELIASFGLKSLVLEINNTGQPESQSMYAATLKDFLKSKVYDLCDSCAELMPVHTMQVFRCNELGCQAIISEAPVILDFLDESSKKHLTNILEALEELQIPYQLNPLYVGSRGTSNTSFVIKYKSKQTSTTIGEGAYHTDLGRQLTGKAFPAFGFVGSLSTIHLLLEKEQVEVARENKNEVYLVPLGELAAKKSLRLFRDLISAKISVYDHFGTVGVKSQLKAAQDSKSPIALIMGQKEAMDEMVILRDVKSGMQEMFSYDKIVEEVKKRLGK